MSALLDTIDRPQDLHGLSDTELARVAQEVREYIIDTIGEIGGHFGANLGACEIAVAIHSLIDSPRDKLLWDVGHQAYPHKVLTGRREELRTIRQYEGLAPFCSIFESEHDPMGAGHASTAISYAVGLKEAMRSGVGEDGRVVAVVGDGALTGGVAFEGLINAGGLEEPIVVVLNDNGMSISPNVGAMSRYFHRLRLNPRWHHAREGVESALTRLPGGVGSTLARLGPIWKESLKAYWAPGLFFEELGFAYVGVIDGHDMAALREAVGEALEADRPVIVHAKTVKGKGFAPAEEGGLEGMERWHAAKPASIVGRAPAAPAQPAAQAAQRPSKPPQYTKVFGEALVEECRRDDRVLGITAAMNTGTGLDILQKAMPERYYDVGIAEQHAVLFAAGLAVQGAKPVVAVYSTFLQRGFDQIVHDVCLQKLDVVFAMDRAGLVGDDGPTHHGAFDVSYLRPLPHIVLMAPRDEAELRRMLRTALLHDGPVALRYPRGEAEGVPLPGDPLPIEIGRGEVLREAAAPGGGASVALVGYGYGVPVALGAADRLEADHGLEVTVADARFAKPLDEELLLSLASEHDVLVTVEENVLTGGFGAGVVELLVDRDLASEARIIRLGLPDRYVTHGKPSLLRDEVGLTPDSVARRVAEAVLEPEALQRV